MARATVNGHDLHYTRRGAGPPLLLIQGLGGHSAHWSEPFLGLLAERVEVIAFDHAGTGRSGPRTGATSIRGFADDAAGLLATLGIERAHVLGLSMGGMIAQELTFEYPELVDRLVLLSTSPSGPQGVLPEREVMEGLVSAHMSGDLQRAVRVSFEANVSPAHAADPEAFDLWCEMAGDRPVTLDVLLAQLQAIAQFDAMPRLPEVTAPTLVVHGTADRMLPVGNASILAAAIPGARLEIVDGAGHLVYLEQPDRLARQVHDFVAVESASR
jgi:3-oxoadipate enol-lactonase